VPEVPEPLRAKFCVTVAPFARLAVAADELNPLAEAETWYVPPGMLPEEYLPLLSVVTISSNALVLALPVRCTVAPAIADPEVLATVP
jgi:hypothetical protein